MQPVFQLELLSAVYTLDCWCGKVEIMKCNEFWAEIQLQSSLGCQEKYTITIANNFEKKNICHYSSLDWTRKCKQLIKYDVLGLLFLFYANNPPTSSLKTTVLLMIKPSSWHQHNSLPMEHSADNSRYCCKIITGLIKTISFEKIFI